MEKYVALSFSGMALTLGLLISPSSDAVTDDSYLADYFEIDSVTSEQIYEPLELMSDLTFPEDDCRPPSMQSEEEELPGVGEFNSIIAIGEKVWKIIEAGRPVVSFKAPVVHALPYNTICWHQLERWQAPRTSLWEIAYKNKFAMKVVTFRFRVSYTPGGQYDGKGQYLANVTVMPASVDVAWGFDFNAEVQVGRTMNLGTRDSPQAGMQLMVMWNVKSMLKESLASESFFVQGDGQLLKR